MPSTMDEAHTRDMADERAFRDLARQIDTLLAHERSKRLSARAGGLLRDAADVLRARADQIVAVWD